MTTVMKEIQDFAASNVIESEIIYAPTLEHGQFVCQGDVMVFGLNSKVFNKKVMSGLFTQVQPKTQLVSGNTAGSRHCLRECDLVNIAFFQLSDTFNELVIGILYASEPWTLTHPEHKHIHFPAGFYGLSHQLDHADEVRRVMD